MNFSISRHQISGIPLQLPCIRPIVRPLFNSNASRRVSYHQGTNSSAIMNSRRRNIITSSYVGELATYRLPQQKISTWFSDAIRFAAKNLSQSSQPFIELVRFPQENRQKAKFTSFTVNQSVVAAPELWSSIAATVSSEAADVLILVQRVDRPHSPSLPQQEVHSSQQQHSSTSPIERIHRVNSEMRKHVEDACQQLVVSGIGQSILQGQVGECCDGNERAALSVMEQHEVPSSSFSGYWGVVVQSRHHTLGVEGCYLLKAIRTVGKVPGECSCTHFSLTRVCQGENLEKQFVESWLV